MLRLIDIKCKYGYKILVINTEYDIPLKYPTFGLITFLCNCHICLKSGIEDNKLFSWHSNDGQRLWRQMPLYSGYKRLPRVLTKWVLLKRSFTYIKVALFNEKYGCLYILRDEERGKKTGCANNMMTGVIDEQADDESQEEQYVSFYDFSTKSFLLT